MSASPIARSLFVDKMDYSILLLQVTKKLYQAQTEAEDCVLNSYEAEFVLNHLPCETSLVSQVLNGENSEEKGPPDEQAQADEQAHGEPGESGVCF